MDWISCERLGVFEKSVWNDDKHICICWIWNTCVYRLSRKRTLQINMHFHTRAYSCLYTYMTGKKKHLLFLYCCGYSILFSLLSHALITIAWKIQKDRFLMLCLRKWNDMYLSTYFSLPASKNKGAFDVQISNGWDGSLGNRGLLTIYSIPFLFFRANSGWFIGGCKTQKGKWPRAGPWHRAYIFQSVFSCFSYME